MLKRTIDRDPDSWLEDSVLYPKSKKAKKHQLMKSLPLRPKILTLLLMNATFSA